MRQFSIVFLLISLILLTSSDMAYSAIRGKIDYSIPIDYSKLSETELSIKAQDFYYKALTYEDNILTEDMTDALLLLMESKPYDTISVTDITKKAGVSRMAFYRNYEIKDDIIDEYFKERLSGLVRHLNEEELMLLIAYYDKGFTVTDISRQLNISDSACYMRLHRARKKLEPLRS